MRTIKFSLVAVFSIMLMLCLSIASYSQNEALTITKKKDGKDKTFEQEEKITILTNTGEVYTGNFTIKEDSLVILGQGSVSLNDIEKISVGSIGLKIIGGTLAGVGGVSSVVLAVLSGRCGFGLQCSR